MVLEVPYLAMNRRFKTIPQSFILMSVISGSMTAVIVFGLFGFAGCGPLAGSSIDKNVYLSQKYGKPPGDGNQASRPKRGDGAVEILFFRKAAWETSELRFRAFALATEDRKDLRRDDRVSVSLEPIASLPTRVIPGAIAFVFDDHGSIPADSQRQRIRLAVDSLEPLEAEWRIRSLEATADLEVALDQAVDIFLIYFKP